MKCIVCEAPTLFKYRIEDVEAAFCPQHLPKQTRLIETLVVIRF
jgi:hypothetical protein